MRLVSTRNAGNTVGALEGVLKGIADDGGLLFPKLFRRSAGNVLRRSAA